MTLFMVGPKRELKMGQKDLLRSATIIADLGLSLISSAAGSINSTPSDQPLFQTLSQAQWKRMLPDLGDASPEIAILHVDPNTHATQLLIRTPQGLHVRKHWHSANETHTMIIGKATFGCEGNKVELEPGGSTTCQPAWCMKRGLCLVPSCSSPSMAPGM